MTSAHINHLRALQASAAAASRSARGLGLSTAYALKHTAMEADAMLDTAISQMGEVHP